MKIFLTPEYCISEINQNDVQSLIKYLNEKEIFDNTMTVPYPYTASDANRWIKHVEEETNKIGKPINFAIRNHKDELIGGIGFNSMFTNHKAELGYWLAKPYWGKGIMSQAVIKICEYGFQEFGLARIQATIFYFNKQSETVLKKTGFEIEGTLKNYFLKEGKIVDGILYAICFI